MQNQAGRKTFNERLEQWFPDREFFMRSQGHVRFIKISSRVQKAGAAAVVALLAFWLISMTSMAWSNYMAESERLSLLEREAEVAKSEERFGAYRDDLDAVAKDLSSRQDFIEAMTETLPEDIKNVETVSDSSSESADMIKKVSASFPEAAALAQIEARQLAFVERLTRFADVRSKRAEKALRQLGVDPSGVVRRVEREAMGGPLDTLATSANGSVDPRFERLGLSLARMSALEQSLETIPQLKPTNLGQTKMSSGYGYRRDPFTRRGAMHRGLDFKGPTGAPIFATGAGRVSFVGRKAGYGNTVEISHGNGVMTRYAHMSAFTAKLGQQVSAGDQIGKIGSTGRSTGPHLHFEVRINNEAVNPRKFLETAPNVLKEARGANTTRIANR